MKGSCKKIGVKLLTTERLANIAPGTGPDVGGGEIMAARQDRTDHDMLPPTDKKQPGFSGEPAKTRHQSAIAISDQAL
jgi:hypothetical protein